MNGSTRSFQIAEYEGHPHGRITVTDEQEPG